MFQPPGTFNSTTLAYSVACNAKAPWVAIKIDGVFFPIDKRDMIQIDQDTAGLCQLGIARSSAPYFLGDTFLTNVVAVFDVGSSKLSFASR